MTNSNILKFGRKLDVLYSKVRCNANKYLISMIWIIKNKANLIGMRLYKTITLHELIDLSNATSILLNTANQIDYYIYREVIICLFILENEFSGHNMARDNSII